MRVTCIRAQNPYGPHRPCKIVLLTLVAPRPTYIFYEKHIQNTGERHTIKRVELSINKHIVDLIHKHHITDGR